ncbi:hypothetical protein NDU88_000873 [Pleurodeles waltl]|uniref:UPAR/Ly6 domain-containing protein n=1 Tax=Pleurodeles waltl TaxID=8319 RepID=A0AAV7Q1H9_PLEWA|nr:hypothetical protein NDU88_000873 [Pleurodeles waltl]
MKRPTLLAFSALLAVCVVAQPPQEPLRCYECSFGCIKRDTTTCKAGEMCSTTTGAANFIKRGCLAQNLCNLVEEKTVMWIPYKIKYSCCSTPLCNN